MSPVSRCAAAVICVALLCVLAGCQGRSLPTRPNLYASGIDPFVDVPHGHRTTDVEILYATDREPIHGEEDDVEYGAGRSTSMAFGRCTVNIGGNRSWDDLVADSLDRRKSRRIQIEITQVRELVRFPSSVSPRVPTDALPDDDPDVIAARLEAEAQLEAEAAVTAAISRRLAAAPRKEVFLFVHGIQNGFEDPVYRMAQLWHMMGRAGVPIVYTWPANPKLGPLRGYTYDRESGEFTIYHLRLFLRLIAACPELERMHILAHSRGTDVALTALRELHLQFQARGEDTRERLKLGNLVLAAPDLDLAVTKQRLRPDQVTDAASRLTIYVSDRDEAIGISEWLFSSVARLGRLASGALSAADRRTLKWGVVDVVDARVRHLGPYGHTYFIDNPAVLSDVILVLRDDREPGAENGRPLIRREDGIWEVRDGYPKPRK